MRLHVALPLVLVLVAAATTSAEPAAGDDAGQAENGGGEAEITAEEVVEQASDWDDPVPWGGNPPPWFEDPASVDCGGRDACEQAVAARAASSSSSGTRGASRP